MTDAIISLKDLRKVFKKGKDNFLAISDVTLDVQEGELVSIVGPSGCGKSTILKILSGLYSIDGGEMVLGNAANPIDPSRDIGYVFQQPLLLNWRKILENVLLPAEVIGLPVKASRARAKDLLDMVGLSEFADVYPYQLSGGMQQRAAIARALIHDPKIILMDEPFGALDALTREKMNLELLRIWSESKKTILFVTHGIQEAVFVGTQVAVLSASPARMAGHLTIDLPQPRLLSMRSTKKFGAYANKIYHLLGIE